MSVGAPEDAGYIHATAFVVGEIGVMVRGPSGAGKSRLTRLLIAEAGRRGLFGRLVGDDRIALTTHGDRLVARGHPSIAGRLEHRGVGIVSVPHVAACVVRALVDLQPGAGPRHPAAEEQRETIQDVTLPRLLLTAGLAELDVADLLDRLLAVAPP